MNFEVDMNSSQRRIERRRTARLKQIISGFAGAAKTAHFASKQLNVFGSSLSRLRIYTLKYSVGGQKSVFDKL